MKFIQHALPGGAAVDAAIAGDYWEMGISLTGDAAMLFSFGLSKVATSARLAGKLRLAGAGIEGAVGLTRAGQGIYAISEGDSSKAAGYFGEATLRLLAASVQAKGALKTTRINCFPTDTLVGTETGLRPIVQVQAGERVWAYDFQSGVWRLCVVECRHDSIYEGPLVTLDVGVGKVTATAYHPFWIIQGDDLVNRPMPRHVGPTEDQGGSLPGRWVNSHDLREGDVVFLRYRGPVMVRRVTQRHEQTPVCNLTVQDLHTFAVGEIQVLVHNTSGTGSAVARGLAKATEHRATAKTFNEARKEAMELAGVSQADTVPFVSKLGPQKGQVVGRVTSDGNKGWRIDFDPKDPQKGFHVNWWDYSGGKKRANWIYGYVQVEGGTEAQYLDLLQHAFGNVHGR